MSSESDPEEFFDAQDITPASERTLSVCSDEKIRVSTDGSSITFDQSVNTAPLLDLEQEEKSLLEIKRQTEERRRKEEREIEQKLVLIEKKKLEELEKQKAEQKAFENDQRRQKLESMRQLVDTNAAFGSSPAKPIRLKSELTGSTPEIQSPEHENLPQKRSNEAEDVLGLKEYPPCDLDSMVPCMDLEMENKTPHQDFMQVNDTLDRNRPANIEVDKAPQKNIPEVIVSFDGEEREHESGSPGMSSVMILEPDIVQSTKTSSLNRQGQQPPPRPVAPPRKKKKVPTATLR